MSNNPTLNKSKTLKYYIHSAIGLAFMFFFQFLPNPEPITEAGMGMLGALIGLIYLLVTVDFVWPSFAAILAYSFHASAVYPDAGISIGLDDGVMRSIGNSICMLMVSLLLISLVLEKTGVMRRMMLWFVTRKFAKKGPWAFTSPAAFAPIAFAVTDEYCDGGYVLKHGIAVTVISAVVVGLLVYPLGNIIC